MQLFRK